jgi:subtilisin family serine protease
MKGLISGASKHVTLLSLVLLAAMGIGLHAIAADPLPPVSVNIKLIAGLTPAEQLATLTPYGAMVTSSVPKLNLITADIAAETSAAVIEAMQADPKIVRVEINKKRKMEGRQSPAGPVAQWALPIIGWDQVSGGVMPAAGTAKVAVLDTGILATHIDLQGKVLPGTSLIDLSDGTTDSNGHGTWLAGIVAAISGNGEGIDGVAYEGVQVMPVKVLAADGTGQDSDVIAGVMWAADHGADVILMGFSNPDYSAALQEAIDYAWAQGIVLVGAVGNDGAGVPSYPAGHQSVIGVSATDPADAFASFSNFGPSVFLAAPGVGIEGPAFGNTYAAWSGTSASAAIVAGAAAQMRTVTPGLPNGVIVGRLARNADPAGTVDQTGNGRLNMARAFADTSMEAIQPVGAPPTGNGGPFVGPYRAAKITLLTSA